MVARVARRVPRNRLAVRASKQAKQQVRDDKEARRRDIESWAGLTGTAFGTTTLLSRDYVIMHPNLNNTLMDAYVHENAAAMLLWNEFDPQRSLKRIKLSAGARRILETPNAGGASVWSEVMSFELMRRAFGASLVSTEMEIAYFPHGGSLTDYAANICGETFGVSVTRAMSVAGSTFGREQACHLLRKKLAGILSSTRCSYLPGFRKQVLHVWAQDREAARTVMRAYHKDVEAALKADTLVMITVCSRAAHCALLFTEKSRKVSKEERRREKALAGPRRWISHDLA